MVDNGESLNGDEFKLFFKFPSNGTDNTGWLDAATAFTYHSTGDNDGCSIGTLDTDLNSKCELNFFGGPTTLYKIEKTFKSSGNAINIRFFDELYQPNAIDKDGVPQQKCDESWSLDNLTIRAISYK